MAIASDAAPDTAMTGAPRLAPGTRLMLVAIPIVLLLGVLGLLLAWRNYQTQRERVIDETSLLAASTAADTERLLRDQIALLSAVAASPSVRSLDQEAIGDYLRDLVADQPNILGIGWIDTEGVIRASALPTDPIAVADRDYFQAVTSTGQPFVSAATSGRLTGRPAFTIAVPTEGAGGALTGVLSARNSLSQLEQAITSARTRQIGDILVVDRAGQMIVDGSGGDIQDVSESSLVQRARIDESGTLVGVDGLRGRRNRIVAFAAAPAGGWQIFVDRPADQAFAAPWRTLMGEAIAVVGVMAAGVGGLLWTGRWLNRATAERERLLAAEHHARTEAESAVLLRDQVLAGVSHDLKNPLATIRGVAQTLRRRIARTTDHVEPAIDEGLAQIEGATTKMAAMMDDLLDAARLQMGQPLELRRERTDLGSLVRRVAAAHQQTTDRHALQVECADDQLTGDWDTVRLERVVDNLLSNAIKYSPAGGAITLSLTREHAGEDDWARLDVRDHGIGIPPEELLHIFDRFYRAKNVAGRIAGSGIGLAGACLIVEQHGGTLSAARALDGGSIFTMRLPLGALPADEAGTEISQPPLTASAAVSEHR